MSGSNKPPKQKLQAVHKAMLDQARLSKHTIALTKDPERIALQERAIATLKDQFASQGVDDGVDWNNLDPLPDPP
jgi:hypothetical protein